MSFWETDSGLENLPPIRLITNEYLYLGGSGLWEWQHTEIRGPYWRLFWNSNPGGIIKYNGEEYELTPDKLVIMAPNSTYSTYLKNPVRHFYLHCFVDRPFSEVKPQLFELYRRELTDQAARLAEKTASGVHDYRMSMELWNYITGILLALPPDAIPARREYHPKIQEAINILNSAQPFTNAALARKVGMSVNGFLLLFRKQTGMTPQDYSRQLRLNEACILLNYSNRSIEEIAQMTGFCDRYHFSRAFRQAIGNSPAKFRRHKN